MIVLRSAAAWLLILIVAVLNGGFREAVLLANLSKPLAFVASGLLLITVILIIALMLARWLKLDTRSRCLSVGLTWLILTVVFEFGFGWMVLGRSLGEMLGAYAFEDGNIWPVVLAMTFSAPLIAARLRGN